MVTRNIAFGSQRPEEIDYRVQADGSAEVWLYDNITEDEEGNYTADGVFLNTRLTKEELMGQKKHYFSEEAAETTIADLVEAINLLTDLVLGGE